jgi:2-hydroxychromene-2-carboxylate isomerase
VNRVDFWFDYACPYAYLAHGQVDRLAERTGAAITWKPFLLGGVFRAIGADSVPMNAMPTAKAKLNLLDMHRFADALGVQLRMPATHPHRTVLALRATIVSGDVPRAARALYRAYWAEGLDVSRPEVVRAALDAAGFDGAALVARADDPAVKDDLRARTDEAVAAGVFGAPAFVTHSDDGRDALYWGQDRMSLVAEALGAAPSPPLARPSRAPLPIDVWFDFSSPFAYLGAHRIRESAARLGAELRYRPFLLGALFKAIGTPDVPLLAMPEAKRRHARDDMFRWAAHAGAELRFPSRFPMRTVKVLRVFLQLDAEAQHRLVLPLFRAFWVDDRDPADDAVLSDVLGAHGLDAARLLAGAERDDVKAQLREATAEAERIGLCGAPSFVVGDQLFWGQDRIELVEKAALGWRPSLPW